jgi:hypothetical protein
LIMCDNDNRINCDFAICTDIFKFVVISIRHESDSTAYLLTNYKVIRISDNKDITIIDNNLTDNQGYYIITNDSKKDIFINKNVEVEFKGYLNDNLVLQTRLTITADCCHVSLVNGDYKFYI